MSKLPTKPVLCIDFDGVIHSYASGWQGADVIPDPPVPGAIEALLAYMDHFTVCIHTSRLSMSSCREAGEGEPDAGFRRIVEALYTWLAANGVPPDLIAPAGAESFAGKINIYGVAPSSPPPTIADVRYQAVDTVGHITAASGELVDDKINICQTKPPARVTIDDRGWTFDGTFPPPKELLAFRPWNQRGV